MSSPPFTITPAILSLVAEIAGKVGRLEVLAGRESVPKLRRENRIKSIHASLAIENNTLSLEQVTAVIEGQRVLGKPSEVQEVKNAFAAYDAMADWNPSSLKNLLTAHRLLMDGLVEEAGRFRTRSVGIAQGGDLIHLAPPADQVAGLVKDLLAWLKQTDTHPLVASCVFHYELEFIHPFADGNGRMGRLWQTVILNRWNPLFSFLPVETAIRERQAEYYRVLGACDKAGKSTAFIEFLLSALLTALHEVAIPPSDEQVDEQVSEQVAGILHACEKSPRSKTELLRSIGLTNAYLNYKRHILPLLEEGLIERTLPEKPNSRLQKYRLTEKGRRMIDRG